MMDDAGDSSARGQPPLTIRASRVPANTWPAVAEEPVSPTARLMDDVYITVTMGFGASINLPVFRAGVETQLARYPRFRCIQVTKDDNEPRWVHAPALNLDDHIIVVPTLDVASDDPDRAVEDYASSLSTAPMDRSRPLWDFHLLDFPTTEATSTAVLRVHHALADGMSLITLLLASTRSAANPSRLRAMPAAPRRSGAVYARPQPPMSAGALAFVAWLWSFLLLAWHTVVDVAHFVAMIVFVRDPHTLFMRAAGSSSGQVPRRTRFLNRSLSLDDVKFLKDAMNCTVNDVLIGVASAALSRYYFRWSGDANTRKISLQSVLLVNMRPTTSLQTYVDMIESGNINEVKWGNQLGYIILPFQIALYEDPLEYVRKAKKVVDRKKSSLEVVFTHMLGEIIIKLFGVKAAGAIFHRMMTHTTIAFSNVIGPAEQVEFYGHPVVSIAPSIYGTPKALNVHYQSYRNTIKVILAVDEDHFPYHVQLLDDFTESLQMIRDAAASKQHMTTTNANEYAK